MVVETDFWADLANNYKKEEKGAALHDTEMIHVKRTVQICFINDNTG